MYKCKKCGEEVPAALIPAHWKAHLIQEGQLVSHPEVADEELGNEEGG
jgi:hypothetical protein